MTLTLADFSKNPALWTGRKEPSSMDYVKLRRCTSGDGLRQTASMDYVRLRRRTSNCVDGLRQTAPDYAKRRGTCVGLQRFRDQISVPARRGLREGSMHPAGVMCIV